MAAVLSTPPVREEQTQSNDVAGSMAAHSGGTGAAGTLPMDDVIRFTNARFGEQEVPRSKAIHFTDGIPGFELSKYFAVFTDPESEPFQWLLSTENPQLGFLLVNPMFIWPDYNPRISKDDLATLGIGKSEDMLLFAIVTLADDSSSVTANLSGPIIVNSTTLRARQLALLDDRYSTRHRIMEALQV